MNTHQLVENSVHDVYAVLFVVDTSCVFYTVSLTQYRIMRLDALFYTVICMLICLFVQNARLIADQMFFREDG